MKFNIKCILSFLALLMCFSSIGYKEVKADENCHVQTYYSRKDWVHYFDMFDTTFTNATEYTNSHLVSMQFNGWGVYSFDEVGSAIWPVSSTNFTGNNPLTVTADSEYGTFYSTFYVVFNSRIKIDDFDIQVEITNESGELLDSVIYVAYANSGIVKVYEGSKDEKVNIKLNDEVVNGIYVQSAKPSNGNTYSLKYFSINSYHTYEHIEWTTDYIEGADTISQEYCDASGSFSPSGGSDWAKNYKTIFVPSIKKLNEEVGYNSTSSWVRYNDGLKIGITANTAPDYNNMFLWNGGDRYLGNNFNLNTSNKNFYWQRSGNTYRGYDNDTDSTYISTSKINNSRKVYFTVSCDVIRCDGGNCNWDWAGGGKHNGHGSNKQDNAYDSYVTVYVGEPVASLNYISSITFYLCDEDKNRIEKIYEVSGSLTDNLEDKMSEIDINKDGIWHIEAEMENPLGDTSSIYSDVFKVDSTAPNVNFDPYEVEESEDPITVKITASDATSGVEKWRYSISDDGGATFSEISNWYTSKTSDSVILEDNGEYVIKVDAVDKAGNSESYYSGIYQIGSKLPPTLIIKSNIYLVNQEVDLEDIKDNAIAIDPKDGNISEEVIVEKIEYEDGRVVDYPSILDTSVAQKVNITYSITNASGLKASATKEYQIVENDGSLVEVSDELEIYSRYINKEYEDSLESDSIWVKDENYKAFLEDVLNNLDVQKEVKVIK